MVDLKTWRRYLELTKPKVTLLNLFVGVTCFVLAELPAVNWAALAVFFVVGYLAVGGCGALNCYFDRGMDGLMERTSRRAIPSGNIAPVKALFYGLILTSTGLAATYIFFGIVTAVLVSLGIVFYVLVYTLLLKSRTHWNVVIGAVAGPFAALAGWTATGNALSLTPVLVGMLDFLWTPSHLWSLAMRMVNEYKSADVPMLPVISGLRKASELVFLFNVATFGFSFLFVALGITGPIYLIIATAAGLRLVFVSHKLLIAQSETQAFRVFLASAPYLACIMIALIVDRFVFVSLSVFAL